MNLNSRLESLLYVVGDEGLDFKSIIEILEIDEETATKVIGELKCEFSKECHGITLEQFGSKYKFVTKKDNREIIKKLVESQEDDGLSQSALEILAIIAYNEPITRTSIDAIRGVNSSYGVRKLVLKDLIQEVGKSDLPGKPILYGTTDRFLDYFGLTSKEDLPKLNLVSDYDIDEVNLFDSKYKEEWDSIVEVVR